jgi:mycoredoxin
MRPLLFVLAAAVVGLAGVSSPAGAAERNVSSIATSPVTIYGAKWCSACRTLERGLKDRKVPFDVVDVDENPSAYARAKTAAGATNAIPLTGIVRGSDTLWIVGADVDAVEKAHRGD